LKSIAEVHPPPNRPQLRSLETGIALNPNGGRHSIDGLLTILDFLIDKYQAVFYLLESADA
jgi:hypothetical protein